MCILITSATLDAIHTEIMNIKDLFIVDSLSLKCITDHFVHQFEYAAAKFSTATKVTGEYIQKLSKFVMKLSSAVEESTSEGERVERRETLSSVVVNKLSTSKVCSSC